MSPGKIAAQAGHAATEATLLSHPDLSAVTDLPHLGQRILAGELWKNWRLGGHYVKYVMEARDNEHIRDIERYLNDRDFRTALILDEGHTEIEPIQPTALGVALVDKDDEHTAATFSSFKLYREPRPPKPEPPRPKPDPSATRVYRPDPTYLGRLVNFLQRTK